MSKFLAQINESNVVIGVSQLSFSQGDTLPSNLIELVSMDVSVIGKEYAGQVDGLPVFNELPVVVAPIRKITRHAFMQRFTQAERIAIRNSGDDVVIDIHETLKAVNNVDLDLQQTIDSLNYLTTTTPAILAANRPDEIRVDGLASET